MNNWVLELITLYKDLHFYTDVVRFGVKSIELERADKGHKRTASWMTKTFALTGEPTELLFVVNPVTTELQKL